MGQLGGFSGRDVARVAQRMGWQRSRQRGSHMVYARVGAKQLIIPNDRELPQGTLSRLIRDMGLTVDEFRELARK